MFTRLFNFFGAGRNTYQQLYRDFGATDFMSFSSPQEKLMYAVKNPAFLKVAALQCDTFSLGEFKLYDKQGERVLEHPLLDVLKAPNFAQGAQEFTWEWMFWLLLGQSTIRATASDFGSLTRPLLIPLNETALYVPPGEKLKDPRNILTKKEFDAQKKIYFDYYTSDGVKVKIQGKDLIRAQDMALEPDEASRIEGLLKVIQNNERTIDSQNINIRYAGKFMVSGQQDPNDVSTLPMAEDERQTIERDTLKANPVQAVKSMIDIKRYVQGKMFISLGEAFEQTYHQIGSMYSIPRDVLEAYNSSTFENQKQARAAHVTYTLTPKARVLCSVILDHFGMTTEGYKLELDYSHLPFMQFFEVERYEAEKTRQEAIKTRIDNIERMRALGLTDEDIELDRKNLLS